ncbi:HD domain-containing protein [Ancylomarina euxinus]|uniref:HD domain-containing protein n=1 Tax=Ancylomarina euxinus TaxID=2283627 RepID=A0A425XZ27_9BACT|nr:HD domain-containing protein [Ancylomarina euxinus]MCZ4695634.1 HD domain-containing protein [Ancylomarina euxinus]MUP16062.1 HD domain-containing protein [Ancylomarina euxinus]RRG20306.1 HD domain-containing protein [Ancylomarina euxinus]
MKHKVLSDPIHGFIHIPSGLLHELVEHPFFQRLRRIRQLGMTFLVFPGANHSRFQHVLGATYLTQMALESLQSKGVEITPEESEAVKTAILLHDIGHGPFSHALEYSIVDGITHERLSELFMDRLNSEFDGRLSLAIKIFKNEYHKPFLNQLVSSQLDMDRLDYLRRDSFFTGVSEGAIGSTRIIKMLDVVDGNLAVEAKGIYSIEKFLIARRLMYWQVYLHKTSLAAEEMLVRILKRAKYLADKGEDLFGTPALRYFLYNKAGLRQFKSKEKVAEGKDVLEVFSDLDDNDIMVSIKVWANHSDKVLAYLCKAMKDRRLFKIEIEKKPFTKDHVADIREKIKDQLGCSNHALNYLVIKGSISNNAYNRDDDRINILFKDGSQQDIGEASDMLNISVLSKTVKKYYLCYPKF